MKNQPQKQRTKENNLLYSNHWIFFTFLFIPNINRPRTSILYFVICLQAIVIT